MTGPERDKLIETSIRHDEIPLTWKLAASVALLLLVSGLAALMTIPFSCLLNNWPQPACRVLQAVTGLAEKGEESISRTTGPLERRKP